MNTNNLKYLTVKIASETDDGTLSVGTGFYIRFGDIPMIVTANHVISEKSNIKLKLRYKIGEHTAMIDFPCNVKWHTLPQYDLACCCVDEIEKDFEKLVGCPLFYRCLTEEYILTEKDMKETDILDEVLMIGYPGGVSSSLWEYPIFQKGCLASAPGDASDEKYVDITTAGGSSGSPLLLLGGKPKLVGIMSRTVTENLISSANLGIYSEAYHLLELKEKIKKK